MEKGTKVQMEVGGDWIYGDTIENVCPSATKNRPDRMVVRVRWEDETETIENVKDLYAL